MGNVFDAMKKHQAEQADQARSGEAESAPAAGGAPPQALPQPAEPAPRAGVILNGYSTRLVAHHDRGGKLAEDYRALRTNLLAQYRDNRFCLLVSSAEDGEGKTVTCLNLAIVLAEQPEYRTVVVDCDLRKGRVASLLRIEKRPGMADLLRGRATFDEVLRPTSYPNLFAVPAGQADADEVGELLGKQELDEFLGRLRQEYDHVLIDTPPLAVVSDAGTVGRAVREAMLVVRMHKTRRESVDKAIRLLHAANVRPVGIALTHQKYYIPSYLYRYS